MKNDELLKKYAGISTRIRRTDNQETFEKQITGIMP